MSIFCYSLPMHCCHTRVSAGWGNLEKAPHSLRMGLITSAPPTSSAKLEIKTLAKPLAQGDWENFSVGEMFWEVDCLGKAGKLYAQAVYLAFDISCTWDNWSCVLYKKLECAKQAVSQSLMGLLSHYRIQSWRV